ncbi:S-adenosyl-L-methionine-dependent methyltransferase [Penicillium taxi]|uniref:S-adenosyl-L-methionine-dependent methyltransferase n=1 Tax=Penicillium taxi TaxID=168475 RepID=UPI00254540BA|nr:S-adenosyl-L-methionine-dependent methyltransferase [Penicillium taxi]KAJ5655120.1 S-adenosyl-L-methionine-dependent methyltransferase [Penicillium lividum]KAJ5901437.1 S-adenosyl-L-methionine-dependent methyltransferase [Penicillium taxi]
MDTLLASYLHDERTRESIIEPKFQHRLALGDAWQIKPGSRVLDVGCGQGESSLVLALATGPTGHIIGIDTAPPDYGGPYTVAQSQKHIQASVLGKQIEFRRADIASLLSDDEYRSRPFDVAVLCHSLWYFQNQTAMAEVFRLLASVKVRYLCLAEYGSRASRPEQTPHVLAAGAQSIFNALRKSTANGVREPNVRSAPTPEEIVSIAGQFGWREVRSGYLQPVRGMRDGHWEVQFVSSSLFQRWIRDEGLEDDKSLSDAIRAVDQSTQALRSEGVDKWDTMDVYWAVLELDL